MIFLQKGIPTSSKLNGMQVQNKCWQIIANIRYIIQTWNIVCLLQPSVSHRMCFAKTLGSCFSNVTFLMRKFAKHLQICIKKYFQFPKSLLWFFNAIPRITWYICMHGIECSQRAATMLMLHCVRYRFGSVSNVHRVHTNWFSVSNGITFVHNLHRAISASLWRTEGLVISAQIVRLHIAKLIHNNKMEFSPTAIPLFAPPKNPINIPSWK